jgi:hypothetical protein
MWGWIFEKLFSYIFIQHKIFLNLFIGYYVMFQYMPISCNVQIRLNSSISSNICHFLFGENIQNPFFYSFFKYLVHYCFLQSPCYTVEPQHLFLLSNYNLVPLTSQPFPILLSLQLFP